MTKLSHLFAAASMALLASMAQAQTVGSIIGADSVSTTMGAYNPTNNPITDTIDQSGLSSTYTSGSTDYDTFTSTATHVGINDGSHSWFSALNNKTGSVTFTFASAVVLDSFALWNAHSTNTNSIKDFALYDDDNNLIGSFSAVKGPGPTSNIIQAQLFDFASAVETTSIRMDVSSNWGGVLTSFSEAAFQVGTMTAPVPEPSSLALFAAGFGLLGAAARRRRTGQAD